MRDWNEIKTVYLKEITEIIRNKRILISTVFVPILIFPIVFGGMSWLQNLDRKKVQDEGFIIALEKNQQQLSNFLKQNSDTTVHIVFTDDVSGMVLSESANAGIEMVSGESGERALWLYYIGSENMSQKAAAMVKDVYQTSHFTFMRNILSKDLSDPLIDEYEPKEHVFQDVASLREKSGHKIAKILPLILIMILVGGCSFAAVDLIAGEKERGCFETLLVSPIRRRSVIIGKMLVVIMTGLTSLMINLVSLFLTMKLGFFQINDDAVFEFSIGFGAIAGIFLCALPMTVLFASSLMLISTKAKTYQSGQTLLMPFTLFAMVPGIAAILPGMKSDSFLMIVPIANVVVAMKEMLEGSLKLWPMLMANAVNLFAAAALVYVTVKSMEREGSLIPESVSDTELNLKALQKDPVKTAIIGYILVWLTIFYFMIPLQANNIISGLLITLWGVILGAAFGIVLFQKLPLRQTLRLKMVSWKVWLGAALFQTGALPVILFLNSIVMKFLPIPKGWLESFNDSITLDLPTFSLILLMGISPGICEEILFRGAIQGSLEKKWKPVKSILVTSILFGLLHFSVYRLFATTVIGIGLGWMVYMSGSLYPAMIAHALNNILALVILPEIDLSGLNDYWMLLGLPFVISGGFLLSCGSGRKRQSKQLDRF
jgi:sodium transport system permease protein